MIRRLTSSILFCLVSFGAAAETKLLNEAERRQIALEAISRLETDALSNPQLQNALDKLLGQIRGTPDFVRLVKKFNLTGQENELLKIACAHPKGELGVEAIKVLLASADQTLLGSALNSLNALVLVEVLGNAKDQRAVPLLLPLLGDSTREIDLRRSAVRALAQTQDGANELINLARTAKLGADLRLTASEVLNRVRWPGIKAEAEQLLPLPRGRNAKALPPIAELTRMAGNASKGEQLYFNEVLGCATCHQVRGRGVEIGPDLSEIGSKLGRDALLESILDPNAGISFGYEAHQIELASGDEAFGLLASETEEEIAIKDLQGIVSRFKKEEIRSRKQLSNSIMPTGLTEGLSAQELVDLVEYLATLRRE
ncbi:MAG: c-type cytochrome [Limisphaerales bacterium]